MLRPRTHDRMDGSMQARTEAMLGISMRCSSRVCVHLATRPFPSLCQHLVFFFFFFGLPFRIIIRPISLLKQWMNKCQDLFSEREVNERVVESGRFDQIRASSGLIKLLVVQSLYQSGVRWVRGILLIVFLAYFFIKKTRLTLSLFVFLSSSNKRKNRRKDFFCSF